MNATDWARSERAIKPNVRVYTFVCVCLLYSSLNRFKAGNMVDIEFNFDNATNDIRVLC